MTAREPRSLDERLQLGPHDRGVDTTVERALGEAAIGAREDVLAANEAADAHEPFGHELGVLDDVGRMADHAGGDSLALWKAHRFPHAPLVLVPRVGAFNQVSSRAHFQDKVDDRAQRHVRRVWARPAAPAYVIADTLLRKTLQRVVDQLDLPCDPVTIILEGRRRHHSIERHREPCVVELQIQTSIDDGAVLRAHGIRDRQGQIFCGLVVLVLPIRDHARRRGDR